MSNDGDSARKERDTQKEWSHKEWIMMVQKDFFPTAVTNLSVQKSIINRFLDFYLGGRRLKGLSVEDVVFAVLSIMPKSPYGDEIAWPSSQFRDDGKLFFLNPEDKLKEEVKQNMDKPGNPEEKDEKEGTASVEHAMSAEEGRANEMDETPLSPSAVSANMPDDNAVMDVTTSSSDNALSDDNKELDTGNNGSNVKTPFTPWKVFPQDIEFKPKPEPTDATDQDNLILSYGPVENSAFNTFCNELLNNWQNERSRAVLKSFCVMVSLVLMRATAKGYKHLVSTFHSKKFLRFLINMKNENTNLPFFPPHKRCLKGAYRTFCRKDNKTPVMFAKLIYLSVVQSNVRYLNYILRNGILNHTANYGLNMVNLWETIYSKIEAETDLKLILELTTCNETESSWERLISFLIKYKTTGSNDLVYQWARILDPSFFRELSCQANYALAVILAVFSENLTGNSSIWQSTWVQNEELDRYRELGNQLYVQYVTRSQNSAVPSVHFKLKSQRLQFYSSLSDADDDL